MGTSHDGEGGSSESHYKIKKEGASKRRSFYLNSKGTFGGRRNAKRQGKEGGLTNYVFGIVR